MSVPHGPDPVKWFLSAIYARPADLDLCLARLEARLGNCDYRSKPVPFDRTPYYQEEMGGALQRQFFSFRPLADPAGLVELKLFTNALELEFADQGRRRINLDPGYLGHLHLILATGKNAGHRPYLGQGIYADLTLIYESGSFQPLRWTYPDYADPLVIAMLNRLREAYKETLRLRQNQK